MESHVTVAYFSCVGILHLLYSFQCSGILEFLLFLVREYAFIGGQVILRLVKPAQCFQLYLAVLTLDTEETGLTHVLLDAVDFLADGEGGRSDSALEHFTHAMVFKQQLLVHSQRTEFLPGKLVLVELVASGEFGDTPFIVQFTVLYQFFAFRSGVFSLSDLDDGVQGLFQYSERNKEETETCGIVVLVLEISKEEFQR